MVSVDTISFWAPTAVPLLTDYIAGCLAVGVELAFPKRRSRQLHKPQASRGLSQNLT
jgi:hypothetical protein